MPPEQEKSKTAPRRIRCAIYTRKSTEEGLDQEFNSLDAQREAAEAFVRSQKREGWVALADTYDDGGFTGANMDRPALQRLLKTVEARAVDCVVVYKVDRLSRSLLDFTRMLSLFDKHNVSFVAVTQHFNTSTSLGRLTLNILLSFAQFERELIGERTRDKMGAARRRGKWVGGCPVLGYDVEPAIGRLVINEEEAERVRSIFNLFIQHRSMLSTLAEIERRGWKLKAWVRRNGTFRPGTPFRLNSLRRLLTNVLYTGMVRHKGQLYPGEHAAIVSRELWDDAQQLITHRPESGRSRTKSLALLNDLLYCARCGSRMVYTYTAKQGRRYPYYVCLSARTHRDGGCGAKSIPASRIEQSVLEQTRVAGIQIPEPAEWTGMEQIDRAAAIRSWIERIYYDGSAHRISMRFRPDARNSGTEESAREIICDPGFRAGQHGREATSPAWNASPDLKLVTGSIPRIARLMALAIRFRNSLDNGVFRDYAEVARLGHVTRARMTQITKLLYLPPDIQEQILFLPPVKGINERNLRKVVDTIEWQEQRKLFQTLTERLPKKGTRAARINGIHG